MTTNPPSSSDERSKRLTEVILKGNENDAARIAGELVHGRADANDLVDMISETMNIVADLHEVERYSQEQVAGCERAAEKALDAIRPRIILEQKRISGRVMVSSLRGDPHTFDKTLLLTMLQIGGIAALDGGEQLSPDEVVRKVEAIRPDVLAIPLVTSVAVQGLIDTRSRLDKSGAKTRIVAYGRGTSSLSSQAGLVTREDDSLGALSKIAEILLTMQATSTF